MIEVSIETRGKNAGIRESVQAESIRQALSLASAAYPGSEVSVVFPIEPEALFCERTVPAEGLPDRECKSGQRNWPVMVCLDAEHRGSVSSICKRGRVECTKAVARGAITQDVVVGQGVMLTGNVTVGSSCRVRLWATVKWSLLLPGSYNTEDGAYLEARRWNPRHSMRSLRHMAGS